MFAELQVHIVVDAAIGFVDQLYTAEHLMQVVQRHTEHGPGHDAVVVEYGAVELGRVPAIRHQHGSPGLGDYPFDAQPVFNGDIGQVHGANVKNAGQPVGFLVQQPNRPRFAFQCMEKDFQAS